MEWRSNLSTPSISFSMKEFNIFQSALIWLSGRDIETVRRCTSAEVNKIQMIGTLVLLPVISALVCASLGIYATSENIFYAVVGSIAWATIVLILDRSIVGYGRKANFFIVFTRVSLAFSSALIMVFLLEVFLLQDVIQEQQTQELTEQVHQASRKYEKQISELRNDLKKAKTVVDEKEKDYLQELDGRGGSNERGLGPIALQKEEAYEQELERYNQLKAETDMLIAQLEVKQKKAVEQIEGSFATGFFGMLESLFNIESPMLHFALWVLRIFLLLIDLMPILIKLTTSGDIKLYFQILDLVDNNQLKINQLTSKDREEAMKKEVQYSLVLKEIALEKEKSAAIIKSATGNVDHLMLTLINVSQRQIKLRERLSKGSKDPVLLKVVLKELDEAYKGMITTLHTLIDRSNNFNAGLSSN